MWKTSSGTQDEESTENFNAFLAYYYKLYKGQRGIKKSQHFIRHIMFMTCPKNIKS